MKQSINTARDSFRKFYYGNNVICTLIIKFILALVLYEYALIYLNNAKGILKPLAGLVLAGVSSFLPIPIIITITFVIILYQLYTLNIVLAAIFITLAILMYLLVFRLCPDKWSIVVLSIFLFGIKLPFLVPILLGMVLGASVIVPSIFATMMAYFLQSCADFASTIKASGKTDINNISNILLHIAKDKVMIAWIIIIVISTLAIIIIRNFRINNNKEIAIIAGGVIEIIMVIVMNIAMKIHINMFVTIAFSIISIAIGIVVLWIFMPLNYKTTENFEFYDDDYCYFVRAVPIMKNDDKLK